MKGIKHEVAQRRYRLPGKTGFARKATNGFESCDSTPRPASRYSSRPGSMSPRMGTLLQKSQQVALRIARQIQSHIKKQNQTMLFTRTALGDGLMRTIIAKIIMLLAWIFFATGTALLVAAWALFVSVESRK